MEITERTIDLKAVFHDKNPRMADTLPGFVFSYLKRIVHQDEINAFLWRNREVYGLDFVAESLKELGARPRAIGLTEGLLDGRCTTAANHPLGGADGLSLLHVTGKMRPDVVVPANDILLWLTNMQPLFLGVNKHGSNADIIRSIEETFSSDKLILFFPAGLASRKHRDGIYDVQWQTTFLKKSIKYERDIVPVHIGGRNSSFFYSLALWRKRLGIRSNIEMLYLVNEMYKFRNKDIEIRFGQRIPWQRFDKSKRLVDWVAALKQHVYEMAKTDDPQSIRFNP